MPLKEVRLLFQVPDAGFPVHGNLSRFSFRGLLPGDYPQQSRLSGTVLSYERHFLPLADLQGNILKENLLSVGLRHIFQ